MAIKVRLNTELFQHYHYAMNKAKIDVVDSSPVIELTRDNFEKTLEVLTALHTKTLNLKTKNITHMERLYGLEKIINEVSRQAVYFPKLEVANSDGIDETEDKGAA